MKPGRKPGSVSCWAFAGSVLWAICFGSACDSGKSNSNDDEQAVSVDLASLPVWHGEITLTIGQDSSADDDFIAPIPLGSDSLGNIYVIDPRLRLVARFDSTGTFSGHIVRRGGGPGEMRLPAQTSGLESGLIWYSEEFTGRLYFVPLDGTSPRYEETGWTPTRLQSRRLNLRPLLDEGGYWLDALSTDSTSHRLRPLYRVRHYRAVGGRLSLIHEWEAPGNGIVFYGGRASMRYPGPPEHPVVFYAGANQVVRVDRPVSENEFSTNVQVRLVSESGETIRVRNLHLPSTSLRDTHRDSIRSEMRSAATLGGQRTVDRETARRINDYVDAMPETQPAFDEAAHGPDRSIWLRQLDDGSSNFKRWVVLDSMFTPVARALVPPNVTTLVFRSDGSWWATLTTDDGAPYVARVRFNIPR